MKTIFLVEDEINLNHLLVTYLTEAGYEVVSFYDGKVAEASLEEKTDLWILDIMLPGTDGYTLMKKIKNYAPDIPVIFISARSAELDRVIGLELGSDDYLPKPFLPRELVLRVQRLLKNNTPNKSVCVMGIYQLDQNKRIVFDDNTTYNLTIKEYDLLSFLAMNSNKALSRGEILDSVWGNDYFGSERVVDDTIRRLRKKLSHLPIEPIYGYGYTVLVNPHE